MNKRTKALQIPPKVKQAVYDRDCGMCILCGASGDPVCHFISRGQGGLGIEENVVTLCHACHTAYDQSIARLSMRNQIAQYLKSQYPDWDETKLIYRK